MKSTCLQLLIITCLIACDNRKHAVTALESIYYPDPLVQTLLFGCDTIRCSYLGDPERNHIIVLDSTTKSLHDTFDYWTTRRQFNDHNFLVAIVQPSDVPEDYGIKYSLRNELIIQEWFPVGRSDRLRHKWPVVNLEKIAEKNVLFKMDEKGRIRLSIDSTESRYELYSYDSLDRLSRKTKFVGSKKIQLEATTMYQYDNNGDLKMVESRDWLVDRFERYCFQGGKLDEIQTTYHTEKCTCGGGRGKL